MNVSSQPLCELPCPLIAPINSFLFCSAESICCRNCMGQENLSESIKIKQMLMLKRLISVVCVQAALEVTPGQTLLGL
jgi:hypothetical protein